MKHKNRLLSDDEKGEVENRRITRIVLMMIALKKKPNDDGCVASWWL